ncbi:MAG TPA: peptide ABC transporter substrate-binding protein [Thermomicrobiales bacterium]|nr:peptide ABC transporter substrate-binding protein [Thermomicrobiales bacterium]
MTTDISTRTSRRTALKVGAAVGATAAIAARGGRAFAQDATPEATSASPSAIPQEGTENQARGEGGELRLLQWQAPTTLNRYKSTGVKDYLAGSLVLEPLLAVLGDGSLAPVLAAGVPSKEAGTLADDLTWVTVTLKEGVVWSDGTPLTSEDVKFTWEWNLKPENGSFGLDVFSSIEDVEIVDELTATIRFTEPNPLWFETITSSGGTVILPKHVLGEHTQEANDAFGLNPVGTGPYIVDSFTPNDQATYTVNELYREPNKPYFSSVLLKGGGDAASAARAVLQTGEFDFAWYVNVEPEVLAPLTGEDAPGILEVTPNISLEYIDFNHSDPRTEVDGGVSNKDTPHPILSDVKVREALTLAIDREMIADRLFLEGNPATANLVVGNPVVASTSNSIVFDPEAANALLDEAGWLLEDGKNVRTKDGQELTITYATTVSSVRQKIQAVVKANLAEIGVKVELVQVDAGQFFDGSAGNTQNITHFPWDLQHYARNLTSARPLRFLNGWYAGPDGENIPQESNSWSGGNYSRWQNDEFDAEYDAASVEVDDEKLVQRLIHLNDLAVQDFASIPLVEQGTNVAYSRRFRNANFGFSPFEYHYWNIANWNFAGDDE